MPVIAPITFNSQGFPQLRNSNEWPSPMTPPMRSAAVQPAYYQDDFDGPILGHKWEWNHNPVISAFSLGNGNGTGLTLRTTSVTKDLYQAQNTLTHRILGPKSRATIKLSYKSMKAGDRAGLVLLRDLSAWVGVINKDGKVSVSVWTGCALTRAKSNNQWSTTATGSLQTSAAIPRMEEQSIWLRATANVAPNGPHTVEFSYSTDGDDFLDIGRPFTMKTNWDFYLGYRYGIFNFATQSLGGSVDVGSFTLDRAS